MKISNNHFSLFFLNTISDLRSEGIGRVFSTLNGIEKWGDRNLAEFRYWLNGKRIYLDNELVYQEPEKRSYTSSYIKIQSIISLIFCTIPGVFAKIFVWIVDFEYISNRNKQIFELYQKQLNFEKKFDSRVHKIQHKVFKAPSQEQNDSRFNLLPAELKLFIMSFLNDKELAHLAMTCKENYLLTLDSFSKDSYSFIRAPSAIIEAMGKEKFSLLPISVLPQAWFFLFKKAPELAEDLINMTFDCQLASTFLLVQTMQGNIENELSALMKNHSIQRIQMPEGKGLIVRVKDNVHKGVRTFVIAQVSNKWMIITHHLSGGLWLFLNDMRFHNEVPIVVDYLRRLFKGEPCGNFEDNSNDHVDIDYHKSKASDILNEGPRLLPDGVTPVIQLWPSAI